MTARLQIPAQGRPHGELLGQMDAFAAGDVDWRSGRTFSLVYPAGDEHHAFLQQAHALFQSANGLNPMAFASLRRMEAEVVQMTASMLHGPPETVGTMTSGGTESILLAVKTYRDRARRRRPWILRPEVVAPRTVHVAFDKACHLFGLRLRHVPVDAEQRADVRAMARAVGRNTVMIVGSAPQYPHGSVDPIEDLAAVAQRRGVPLHVDACFGGFLLPWMERLGRPVPPFDLRVPGVSSISADVHKYGYASKGASVLLYRSMDLMRDQFFVATDWPGGVYASPTLPGTRPGGSIAAAWASMMAMGESGYLELTRQALAATDRLRAGVAAIPGLVLLGCPDTTIVTFGASDPSVDVYALADRLEQRGWHTDRQQHPACIHCTVNASNAPVLDRYLADLAECVATVRAHPEWAGQGTAAMYGMIAKVPLRGLARRGVLELMQAMYGPGAEAPDLATVGEPGGAQGPLLSFMARHGAKAQAALEVLGRLRSVWGRLRG